ncbi:alpha/beta fold hydrolase [Burkholderia sp. Ac-20379]|uniref:alpha/beta fold hydrolase n=1 Tax=Burkholderia sp. Ac-20379 TaxID=2703900 RepID=UPI00198087C6|nr:alpha/beta hydrolase [Burkholderia sp. Ac-20379]MBN3724814.1 alpha/beta hydrolase [Burkholderia sp. Ac-20379]
MTQDALSRFATPAADAAHATLFATDAGTGVNVMFIHGWTCDAHDWMWQLPHFERRYRVIAVDLRGHGRSTVTPPGTYRQAHYVADIESMLAAQSAGGKFVLIGHSMGAQIAARLAATRPDLVGAVVSIDGSLGVSGAAADFLATLTHDLETGDPAEKVPALFQLLYDANTDPALQRWHARRAQGTPAHVARESFGPLYFGDDQIGMGEASEAFCRSLAVPVYHLGRDPEQATRMRAWFAHPQSRVERWSDTGHWIMQDRKDDVNAAVTAWIDDVASGWA